MRSNNWLVLYLHVEWKFINLKPAFAKAVGTPSPAFRVYLCIVCSNVVGDTEHPLLWEMIYKQDES